MSELNAGFQSLLPEYQRVLGLVQVPAFASEYQ
jgi:hypothetical protein